VKPEQPVMNNFPAVLFFCPSGELGGSIPHWLDMIRLCLRRGLRLTVVVWPSLSTARRRQVESLGCPVVEAPAGPLAQVHELPRSIAVGVCDREFLDRAEELGRLGCRRVWVNCMTWMFPQEGFLYRRTGLFEAYVFQSEFQCSVLEQGLSRYSYRPEQGHLIRSEFEFDEWPFEPQMRHAAADFVVGKLARPDLGKWPKSLWEIYGRIQHPRLRAIIMGVDDDTAKWMGAAPGWAEVLPPMAMPPREFYRRLHCLMPINFSVEENWPRIGLEAMACGVPIVAPRVGGWCDMITHGENGFLASSAEEFGEFGTLLANDEPLRQRIAVQARRKLETELANPDLIWAGWKRLFASLGVDVP
jgi:hypothetical protein